MQLDSAEKKEKAPLKKINSLGDRVFYISDPIDKETYEIDWFKHTNNMSLIIFGQQLVIDYCKGYSDNLQGLSRRWSTIRIFNECIQRLFIYSENFAKGKPLSRWTKEMVKDFIVKLTKKEIRISTEHYADKENIFASYKIVGDSVRLLANTYQKFLTGSLSDGLSFKLHSSSFIEKSTSEILKDQNIVFNDWKEREHWPSVPIEIAMLLLRDAINGIQTPDAKALNAYFKQQRSDMKVSTKNLFDRNRDGFDNFCKTGKAVNKPTLKRYRTLKTSLEKRLFPDCDSENICLIKFPWTHGEIKEKCDEIYDHCILIILALTGVRSSEFCSILSSDYDEEPSGEWIYTSENIKTNHSCPEIRQMSGRLVEAADLLTNLSYTDKRKHKLSLIGRYFYLADYNLDSPRKTNFRSQDKRSIGLRLGKYYKSFCAKYGSEFGNRHPSISPHQFRHTLAEFALRRFDGNVFEAIRAHFRHRSNSKYTTAYTEGKLKEEQRRILEQNYIEEILERIDSDEHEWFGPAAHYMKKKIQERCRFVDPSEISNVYKEVASETIKIGVHSYGYCLVSEETAHQAKCFDKRSGIPEIKQACFLLCSSCTNSCHSKKSHLENLKRIAISHTDFMNNYPLALNEALKSASKFQISRAESLIKEMGVQKQ